MIMEGINEVTKKGGFSRFLTKNNKGCDLGLKFGKRKKIVLFNNFRPQKNIAGSF